MQSTIITLLNAIKFYDESISIHRKNSYYKVDII